MNNTKAKRWLFLSMSAIMLLPFLEYKTQIVQSGGLAGMPPGNDTPFSLQGWLSGSYQKHKTGFINDSFGFIPDFVRANNQVEFWAFHKIHSFYNNLYLGYDNYLFDAGGVTEYNGLDFVGDEIIAQELWKLKRVQDTFQKLGKTVVIAYGPSKPYLFPDKMPGWLSRRTAATKTNYTSSVRIGDSLKLNQIDLIAWLKATNDTDRCSIIGKRGLHWTPYAALLACDTLIKFIERDQKISMPEIKITAIHRTDSTRPFDDDLSDYSNLVFPLKKEKQVYADYHYVSGQNSKKPKIIYIGDSFVAYMLRDSLMTNTNTNWQYWFYFNVIHDEASEKGQTGTRYVRDIDWVKEVTEADGLVILYTTFNLNCIRNPTYPANALYDYYYPVKK